MDYPIRTLQQLRPILVGFRKQAGLSQAAVAEMLGVTQQSYARIEANPAATSVGRLFNILRLLGSQISLILEDPPKEEDASANDSLGEESASASTPQLGQAKKGRPPAPKKILPPSKENW